MSIEPVMPSNHLILCHPLLLPSVFSSIRVFSNKLAVCIRWPKYWSFSFSISPSSVSLALISLKIDWFDLLSFQGTLKSHHSLKVSVLWHSAFFIVQLSHMYMTPGKTIALTLQAFFGKAMSFNTLSRFVIAFLPWSSHLLISCLQSPSAILESSEEEICHCFHLFPFYLPWSDGTGCHDLSCFNNGTSNTFTIKIVVVLSKLLRVSLRPFKAGLLWLY